MKKSYALYGGADDLEAFGRRVGVERLKENAIDAGVTRAAPVESSHSWSQRMIDKLQAVSHGLRRHAAEAQRVLQRSM